jgi:hypothetical protein
LPYAWTLMPDRQVQAPPALRCPGLSMAPPSMWSVPVARHVSRFPLLVLGRCPWRTQKHPCDRAKGWLPLAIVAVLSPSLPLLCRQP